jgi:ribulose 1,5-bisphosphate synthetase/thiazole synthase
MIFTRTWPEDTLLCVDPLIADAGVVSDATGAGLPQFCEHLRRIRGEEAATIQPIRKFLDQPQIVMDACWWR